MPTKTIQKKNFNIDYTIILGYITSSNGNEWRVKQKDITKKKGDFVVYDWNIVRMKDGLVLSNVGLPKEVSGYDFTHNKELIKNLIDNKENKQINGNMKYKKGSKQAKDFMAKLRASRGKNTLGAVKKKKSAPKKKKLLATESKTLQATLKKKKLALPHGYELKKRKLSGLHSGKNYRMKIGANITRAGEIKALKKFAKQRKSKLHIKVANIIAVNTDKNQFPVNYMTEVVKYGCSSGIVPQLIYYTDTIRFLKAYQKEILEILGDLMDDMGVKSPSDLFGNNWDNSDPFATENNNKNLLAWFGFEEATRHLGADLGYDI